MNRYGYRYLVARADVEADRAVARLGSHAEKLQRREKGTNRPFIPVQLNELENQWNGLINFTQGMHPDMSVEAARCCQAEVARVFKFTPHVEVKEYRDGNRKRTVRRVEFKDVGLATCECEGGIEPHYDLDADTVLDEIKALMPEVLNTDSAEEAHAAAWCIDALITVLCNHGIEVNYGRLWNEACPPLERVIPIARWPAYKAWDEQWRIVGENAVAGEVRVHRSLLDRFHRAKHLLAEEAAGSEARPYDPPADWEPPTDVPEPIPE